MTPYRVEAWIAGRPFAIVIEAYSAEDAATVVGLLWPEAMRICTTQVVHVAVPA